MNRKRGVVAVVMVVLIVGAGWAWLSGGDAAAVEAKQKRDELFQKIDTLTPEQRRVEFASLREMSKDLSEEQRRELRRGGQQYMMQRFDKLLTMPPKERNRELDKIIDRMETDQGDRKRDDRGRDMSQAQRDQRRKERLDRTSPDMRAKMDLLRDMINDRRKQRGMEPVNGGGRGMFGRGPR